ncbi:MAG: glycosyl transferase [Acidobacteria bacterium]|nr:glycosyl transferase [Acidobacteriota bacterium]
MGTAIETPQHERTPQHHAAATTTSAWRLDHLLILLGLWLIIFVAALHNPPLLDDADATHAQAAQAMLSTGDWVTLHVDGIRYLEKPPLPYWITAISLRLFAPIGPAGHSDTRTAAFAVHFPLALTILGLALLGYAWSRRAFPPSRFGPNAPLYTGIFTLTSVGVFLFTRVFIPDALLSLLLALCLYALLRSLETPATPATPAASTGTLWPYIFWIALALAVLTKGLVALVFIFGTALAFLLWTRQLHQWRRLRPLTGTLLFLAIAAPWHILAGLRNTGGADGHGFFWFYFINEHVLRFLGRRIPRDYNKLPGYLYWSLHLVWLFPWSLFAPSALILAWRNRNRLLTRPTPTQHAPSFTLQTIQILTLFSAFVLLFFSLSTNQEYYTFPVYLPLLMLLAAALSRIARSTPASNPSAPQDTTATTTPGAPHLASEMWVPTKPSGPTKPDNLTGPTLRRALTFSFAAFTLIGLCIAAALAYGLWSARHLPFVPDIGDLLAHRNVGDYTLSMSHFFDLTGPSFAALRLPSAIALLAFLIGPPTAWLLFTRTRALPAMLAVALTSTAFLVAAHIALVRFAPMLSSANFAQRIEALQTTRAIAPNTQILLFGDQAYGSSIPFYLNRRVLLVDGRSTSMLFGSTFPDAPPIFLTSTDLLHQWGRGPRKLLFVPLDQRSTVDHLLGSRQIILAETSGKALITDRPLTQP